MLPHDDPGLTGAARQRMIEDAVVAATPIPAEAEAPVIEKIEPVTHGKPMFGRSMAAASVKGKSKTLKPAKRQTAGNERHFA